MGCETLGLIWTSLLDKLSRNATPNLVSAYLSIGENQCSGCHYSTFTYVCAIKYGATHTNKATFTKRTGMHSGIMTDCNVILKDGRTSGISDVYHSAILHIAAVSHSDRSHIASHHSVKPH